MEQQTGEDARQETTDCGGSSRDVVAKFCVGIANDPQPEDKFRYFDRKTALVKAKDRAMCNWHLPVCVWDSQDEIVRLFLCGEEFERIPF